MWNATIFLTVALQGSPAIVADQPPPKLLTGRKFRSLIALPQKQLITRRAKLRDLLRLLTKELQVGIILDRRVDPSQRVKIEARNQSLLQILETVAKASSAEATVVGDFIYIAPVGKAQKLVKIAKARTLAMREIVRSLPRRERGRFTNRKTLHWHDLDEPRGIVQRIAKARQLKVEAAEKIPHDLWAGSTIPNASLAEQLSLILTQYDLTFQWGPRGDSIRIVPVEKTAPIEKAVP